MTADFITFWATRGITFLVLVLVVLAIVRKRETMLMACLFGAVACFFLQYILYPLCDQAVFQLLDMMGAATKNFVVSILMEILFAALFETVFFLLISVLLKKQLDFDSAVAFAAGYWGFTAVYTLAINLFDVLLSESVVFLGSELEILASGVQLPLMLPLYCCFAALIARGRIEQRPGCVLSAFLINIGARTILALPDLTGTVTAVAMGFFLFVSLMLLILTVKTGKLAKKFEAELDLCDDQVPEGQGEPSQENGEDPEKEAADQPEKKTGAE